MSARAAAPIENDYEEQVLDVDTSAAVLRWMETGRTPDGIAPVRWEQWLDSGCQEPLEADGMPVTPTMLGLWASTGALR